MSERTDREHRFDTRANPPFRLDLTVWALRRRSHNEIDAWDQATSTYRRSLLIAGRPVGLAVTQPDRNAIRVKLSDGSPDADTELPAGADLERILGLSADLSEFFRLVESDPHLGPIAERMRGVKPPRFPTVFEALVNGVACQQLSIDVGIHLLNRLTGKYGLVVPGSEGEQRVFPGPGELAGCEPDELRQLGFSLAKGRTIIDASRAIVTGDLDLEELEDFAYDEAMSRLTALWGVGRWTAEYVLLRGLGRLDVFPGDDIGAHNKLRNLLAIDSELDYDRVGELVARWHPYAGLVYFHLLLDSLEQTDAFPSGPA